MGHAPAGYAMQVRHLMSNPVLTISPEQDLESAALTMVQRRIGALVVVDAAGKACGIVTEKDLVAREPANPFAKHRRAMVAGRTVAGGLDATYADVRRRPIAKVMRQIPAFVREDDPVEKAVDLMLRHDVNHLPVLRDGKPVGMLARLDLIRLLWSGVNAPQPDV